ncbi:MAG: glycoside hydrolase [Acidobacteriota bacterium]|nr:glycoside hydrolase [Acidobacteriota bacterium]
MSRVNVAILWHMHQPQYRDPSTGRYLLPWTRLHALKDYWGMVKILEDFPRIHLTFNMVPSLVEQIEEYAGGRFSEPWFDTIFCRADGLSEEQKFSLLATGFHVNENYLQRWPRYGDLAAQARSAGAEACAARWPAADWRDLQLLSQLAWMDEEYLAKDPAIRQLSAKGKGFSEDDKIVLMEKQHELLAGVLPEYRRACERGQIEISTTPYYHPILPLLCDSNIARVANPHSPLPHPAFRYPEDARAQLGRARQAHRRVFGSEPAGLWPSEGSVSDQVLELASEMGFQWFATDEGVLGRTRNEGFWRDAGGFPENAQDLYSPWRYTRGGGSLTGFFRDHYLSDLIGFVYSRMGAEPAAADLHGRIRAIADRTPAGRPATVSLILDGENAWEYYPQNGREFLRGLYGRLQADPDMSVVTMSEAAQAIADPPRLDGVFPASWINANFDVWIGHAEDVRAWDLLRDARDTYARVTESGARSGRIAADSPQARRAYESILAAEGSDWCWWYGPEHASANDADFDRIYRNHLTEVYNALREQPPDALAHPIKRAVVRGQQEPASAYLDVLVDGRESNYFEWLGAGVYSTERRGASMHGGQNILGDLRYGFGPTNLFIRLDPLADSMRDIAEFQVRLTMWDSRETRITLSVHEGNLCDCIVEQAGLCLLRPEGLVTAGCGKIVEIALARSLFDVRGRQDLLLSVALWIGGLPIDILPIEGMLHIPLGEDNFAWPAK